MLSHPAQTRLSPWTSLRCERILPARGEVLVSVGDWVEPDDEVARCQVPGRLWVVDLLPCRGGPRRPPEAKVLLHKMVGDTVQASDELAQASRRFERWRRPVPTCRAPVDGRVLAIRAGQMLIEAVPQAVALRACMSGRVSAVLPERGVVLSAAGALLQGVWGSGGQAHGPLRVVAESPAEPLRAQTVDGQIQGCLLVVGQLLDQQALEFAAEAGVRGIIAGSVSAELCRLLSAWPCPVLVTDGFGNLPMSLQAFSLLRSCAGCEAMLHAGLGSNWVTHRPEVLVPMAVEGRMLPEQQPPQALRVGVRVRALRAPHLGAAGTAIDLGTRLEAVETGACLPVATVALEDGETVTIPLANLEIVV